MIGKIYNLLVMVSVLMLVSVAGALPAVTNSGVLSFAAENEAITQVSFGSNLFKVTDFSDSSFIEIGKELSEPTVVIVNSIDVQQLPAVPATLFMVLSGFLCVSLVRDHKVWLSVVFGALRLGVAGVNVVPRLLVNYSKVDVKQSSAKEAICVFRDFFRPMFDVQGTRYVGLLRRMTTAGDDGFADNYGGKTATAHRHSSDVLALSFLRSALSNLHSYLSAIISFYNSQFSLAYLPVRISNLGHSSQVFILADNFTHGLYLLRSNLPSYFTLNDLRPNQKQIADVAKKITFFFNGEY